MKVGRGLSGKKRKGSDQKSKNISFYIYEDLPEQLKYAEIVQED